MTTIAIPMHWVRETKRTNRYEADGLTAARHAAENAPAVDCVYLSKASLNGSPAPKQLIVEVKFL